MLSCGMLGFRFDFLRQRPSPRIRFRGDSIIVKIVKKNVIVNYLSYKFMHPTETIYLEDYKKHTLVRGLGLF